ncbi:MAG TPA: DUF1573 domain-containing protein [Spirochaetota bacterium]|jgi:hypothetical protein|nr:MAG: hypothetical protein BWX91_01414 [Spirochaetes bacterium ADurb.Bin133]HNZ25726.1 DUF1573 domain-containing protein [Spirochaetota bacterium]HPY87203.1 DUF1573 domain-containing protein [Spirochaetota bacterium]
MKKKFIIPVFILFNFCCFSQPKITVTPPFFDFGEVSGGKIVSGEIFFENLDPDTVKITFRSNCESIFMPMKKVFINPSKSLMVRFEMSTKEFKGDISKELDIYTNDNNSDKILFQIKGKVLSPSEKESDDEVFIFKRILDEKTLNDNRIISLFSFRSCHKCLETSKELSKLSRKMNATFYYYPLEYAENKKNLFNISKELDVFPNVPLVIYLGDFFDGYDKINKFIEKNQSLTNISNTSKIKDKSK